MKKTYKNYVFLILFAGLLLLVSLPALNIYIDRFGIFRKEYDLNFGRSNENLHFRRIAWVLDNGHKYDSFLFGSSRIKHGLPLKELGKNWYIIQHSGAHIYESSHSLAVFRRNHVPIKDLILAIDGFEAYRRLNNPRLNNRILYPDDGLERVKFFLNYLFKVPDKTDREILLGIKERKKDISIILPHEKKLIDSFHAPGHEKMLEKLDAFGRVSVRPFLFSDSVYDYSKFVDLSKGSALKVIYNPQNYKTLIARDFNEIYLFAKALAEIQPYYEFRQMNDFTLNNKYWFEGSHFTADVGRAMLKSLRHNDRENLSFGTYMTPEKIDSFFIALTSRIKDLLPALLMKDKNIIVNRSLLITPPLLSIKKQTVGENTAVNAGIVPEIESPVVLKLLLSVPDVTEFKLTLRDAVNGIEQLYYRKTVGESYTKLGSADVNRRKKLKKITFYVPLMSEHKGREIIFHPGTAKGLYTVSAKLFQMKQWKPPQIIKDSWDFAISKDIVRTSKQNTDLSGNIWDVVDRTSDSVQISPRPNVFISRTTKPKLFIDIDKIEQDKDYIIEVGLKNAPSKKTMVKIFWKKDNENYSDENSSAVTWKKRMKNKRSYLRVPGNSTNGKILLLPGGDKGEYEFSSLEIRAISTNR
jgi:hypothetical protein